MFKIWDKVFDNLKFVGTFDGNTREQKSTYAEAVPKDVSVTLTDDL